MWVCKIRDKNQFDSLEKKKMGKEKPINLVLGTKDNDTVIQGIEYDKKKWTKAEAEMHCYQQGGYFFAEKLPVVWAAAVRSPNPK